MCEKIEQRTATDNPDKPLFLKRLQTFWALNPQYNSSNTLMIENDVEKVDLNPAGNVLCPAEWKAAGQGKDDHFLHPKGEFCDMLRELAACEDIPTFAQTATHLPAVPELFLCHQPRRLPRTVKPFLNQSDDVVEHKLLSLKSLDRVAETRADWIMKTGVRVDPLPPNCFPVSPFFRRLSQALSSNRTRACPLP